MKQGTSLPVIVVGGGGHAKVLVDALMQMRADIVGYTDVQDKRLSVGGKILPYLGVDDQILQMDDGTGVLLVNGLGSVNLPLKRQDIFNRFRAQGYHFATVVHPSAVVGEGVILGEGAQIMAGVILQTAVEIGNNTIVNTRASIDHECVIGPNVHIAPGATLSGCVTIGANSHVGTGAVIVQGVMVGENVLVGAGAVVIRNVENGATVMGVPAQKIMRRGIWGTEK